ncbi:heat shock 70 kDa protein 12A-like [Saccostrea cucullata]|uniref:heat shock 70 kDa protein 12A-like n=1 Tax=Saccostrea cuccullata TaxID=36930 RepID=UPI002ED5F61F
METGSERNYLLVAALDFGTTYSGYAYSFRNNPKEIYSPGVWNAGDGGLASLRTPTCLLLNPDRSFNDFGFNAENKYADLCADFKHHEFYFFEKFKMELYHKTMRRDAVLKDISGKNMPALLVFSLAVRYLKEELLSTLTKRGTGVSLGDIKFILTVPAIWSDSSKQFMREAAVMAGLPNEQLILALEPEVASVYCLKVPLENMPFGEVYNMKTPGYQYLLADIGGGTADFSVHEVNQDRSVTEIYTASGGAYGGQDVNERFLEMLLHIFGKETIDVLKSKDMEDYLSICRSFENKKRIVSDEYLENFRLKLPTEILDECSLDIIQENIRSFYNEDLVSIQKGKLKISSSLMKMFFDKSLTKIKDHIHELISRNSNVKSILLVGGYGESKLLQSELKKGFPEKNLVIPQDCNLSVVKGAVLYGYYPLTIFQRKMRFSYGVKGYALFEKGKHPEHRKIKLASGDEHCEDAFDVLVPKNATIPTTGLTISRTYCTASSTQKSMDVYIYKTEEENPIIVDGKCSFLKRISLPLPVYSGRERVVEHNFTFGLTEVKHQAKILETGQCFLNTFDLL